ncbi:hypothetical protein HET69_07630 [Streptomyces sp. CJ_13]|uniref:hypothetical protein n=1 Tax=Streptomyces sp. CJ_13 TaxID=2724943 RepID=UPI001BDC7B16|nr:hypothetical protein [Streptomyces sp. CJ_13]MBT1183888.1 hypothetical protein [Streptomyces sp. CJ_13]
MSRVDRRPTEAECWDGFWEIIGKAAARRYLREMEELNGDHADVIDFPAAA